LIFVLSTGSRRLTFIR